MSMVVMPCVFRLCRSHMWHGKAGKTRRGTRNDVPCTKTFQTNSAHKHIALLGLRIQTEPWPNGTAFGSQTRNLFTDHAPRSRTICSRYAMPNAHGPPWRHQRPRWKKQISETSAVFVSFVFTVFSKQTVVSSIADCTISSGSRREISWYYGSCEYKCERCIQILSTKVPNPGTENFARIGFVWMWRFNRCSITESFIDAFYRCIRYVKKMNEVCILFEKKHAYHYDWRTGISGRQRRIDCAWTETQCHLKGKHLVINRRPFVRIWHEQTVQGYSTCHKRAICPAWRVANKGILSWLSQFVKQIVGTIEPSRYPTNSSILGLVCQTTNHVFVMCHVVWTLPLWEICKMLHNALIVMFSCIKRAAARPIWFR